MSLAEAPPRPNAFEVDLQALAHNIRTLRRSLGPQIRLYAALKANGYGFGLEQVALTATDAGVDALAMVEPADAVRARRAGVRLPILLYGGALIDRSLVACLQRHSLAFTVVDEAAARQLSELARANVDVFVKIDVGMERLGAAPRDGLRLVELTDALPGVSLAGIYTHMHVAAGAHVDAYIDWQVERFQSVLDEVTRAGIDIPLAVAASSPVLALRGGPAFGGVDAGHLLYGMQPSPSTTLYPQLRRVFKSLKTRLVQCKAVERDRFQANAPFPTRPGMRIGIIPIGRADGLQSLTCGEVLLHGRRCPIVGGLSLEHARIDITAVDRAAVGDEVVIIGEQGSDAISVAEVAASVGLDEVGVAVAVGSTIPRVYEGAAHGSRASAASGR